MNNTVLGLHHITAIAGDAQRNYDFYVKLLGLRLVKKTVNFDDPGTYHFYYGDRIGTPGSILTFFPWEGIRAGRAGTGMATEIGYSVPVGSLSFWKERFAAAQLKHGEIGERFGNRYLSFQDEDGLILNLVETQTDDRSPWTTADINTDVAIRGFYNIVLTVRNKEATAAVITDVLGYSLTGSEGNRYQYKTDAIETANIIELVEEANGAPGINAAGTNHHVAFRVADDTILMQVRERVKAAGLSITEKIDRNYFYSLYFREPGGVLFELASDNPGFVTDETEAELGTHLMLPPQYEPARTRIEEVLPKIKQ